MRPIKFRVWDKSLEEMRYSINIPSDYTERNGSLDLINMFQTLNQRYVFMQYTGLKDCHGREIYEGDIVIAWSAGVKAICEVKWGRGRTGFFLYRKPNIAWNLSGGGKDYNEENVEVIGNIFQDGDLLCDS